MGSGVKVGVIVGVTVLVGVGVCVLVGSSVKVGVLVGGMGVEVGKNSAGAQETNKKMKAIKPTWAFFTVCLLVKAK